MTAYKMIKEHEDVEGVLTRVHLANEDPKRKKKYILPDNFRYAESRVLFSAPDVIRDKE